jgi:molybdopterin converting factor small subunit
MRIKALFHGILSDWVGVPQAEFNLPNEGNVTDLISAIRTTYGHTMPPQLLNKDQEAFHRAVWAVRGKERLAEPTARLKDGEEITFYLAAAGG